ncbi:hypothetical protein C5748_03805 [Phyllobacterium phragmitis]|uniref:Uncharacterized protein n=1 Tax=Phyllobacterium phragmitis TaxID=2670329 RepID=A0A2S9IXW8_9HYPH|nr:hypothetical protein [Phyllobacterium phragmitis]PRD45330.1 hypothetical protein C5748_03805 [Phyllobacterium phragmitis]
MADRILIGLRGDEMGVWVSLPGRNVGNAADRMIFSSQYDYLKIHAQGTYQIQRYAGTSNPYLYEGSVQFPKLDYYPLHMCSFCVGDDSRRIFFPNDSSLDSSLLPNCEYVITDNAIYFSIRGYNFRQDVFVRWVVFKNKLADL